MMRLTEVPIIGFSGKIGSGKTTFVSYLRSLSQELEPRSFAEILRQMTALLINRPVDRLRTTDDKNTVTCLDMTVGTLLQRIGTELVRIIHPDAWVRSLAQHYQPGVSRWVIDDVRFPNEADWIKSVGGIVIRFEGDPGCVRATTTRDVNHPSETALDNYTRFDAVIQTERFMFDMAGLLAQINASLSHINK